MASIRRNFVTNPFRMFWSVVILLLSSLIVVLGSLDAYQIEDDGVLGRAAHKLSPLVNLTYEGMYVSAIVIFSLVVFLCIQLVSHWLHSGRKSIGWLAVIAALTILLAFGGLFIRQPLAFLVIVGSFALILVCVTLLGYRWKDAIAKKKQPSSGESPTLGVSASLFIALILNLLFAIGHTVVVQWQTPALYAATFSGLTGGYFSEYILFNILGVAFVLSTGIALLIVIHKGEVVPPRRNTLGER